MVSLEEYFDENIVQYYKTNYTNITETYKGLVYDVKSNNEETMLKNKFSFVAFKSCEEKLRIAYQILDSAPILIGQIESLNPKRALNPLTVNFYSSSGEKLDARQHCSNEIIEIKHVINPKNFTLSRTSIDSLVQQNVDVFNPNDQFFNDKCTPFSSNNETVSDISMDIRRKNYYQNVSLCGEGCQYIKVDIDNLISKCSCQVKNIVKSGSSGFSIDKEIANQFKAILTDSNYQVVKCSNLVFTFSIFSHNIGNYFLLLNFIGQIANLILYLYNSDSIFQSYIDDSPE